MSADGTDVPCPSRLQIPASFAARRNISTNISRVSLPVCVFWFEGWYDARNILPSGQFVTRAMPEYVGFLTLNQPATFHVVENRFESDLAQRDYDLDLL